LKHAQILNNKLILHSTNTSVV